MYAVCALGRDWFAVLGYSRGQHVVQQPVRLLFLQGQLLRPVTDQLFQVVAVRLQHLYHVVHYIYLSISKVKGLYHIHVTQNHFHYGM